MSFRALLDATPAAGEVVARHGVDTQIGPVPTDLIISLAKSNPAFMAFVRNYMGAADVDRETMINDLLGTARPTVIEMLAAAAGDRGDKDVVAELTARADATLLPFLNAAVRQTMPSGAEDFFVDVVGLLVAAGVVKVIHEPEKLAD